MAVTLPALLFLLVIGFALGQWVTPDEIFGRKLLFDGVNLSVAIILFEGSLGLKLREVRDLGRPIFFGCAPSPQGWRGFLSPARRWYWGLTAAFPCCWARSSSSLAQR
ncbi:transporter [Cutibacterium acnes JCM 18909]|nr:transporter [Cutibacterium acnes JCM 18909]